jgi:hypothetical protein
VSADVWTQPMRPLRGSRRVRLDESGELVSATDRALAAERDAAQARRELVEARAEIATLQAEQTALAAQLYQRAVELAELRAAPAEVVRVVRVAGPVQPPTRCRRPRVVRVPMHPVAALVAAFEARARGVRS